MIPLLPSFTLPMGNRDYPYGMPVMMMTDLHSNTSTYEDNTMAVVPPYNPYSASGLIKNNLSRTTPLSRGSNYAPQAMSTLNTISLISMRQ